METKEIITCRWCKQETDTAVIKSRYVQGDNERFVQIIREDGPLCPKCAAKWEEL